MKTSTLVSLLAFTTLSNALPVDQSSSSTFALVVTTQEQTYNGSTLIPCEKGKQGPFPGLCPLAKLQYPISEMELAFTLNSSTSTGGYLTYKFLPGMASGNSGPMVLNSEAQSSAKIPTFGYATLATATPVTFNAKNLLGIAETGSASPMAGSATYGKWYLCSVAGGDLGAYMSMVWNVGDVAPKLDSCVKADVVRVFG